MFDSILLLVEYGGYVSITKLVIFLVFFFPSWALIQWMHKDAEAVGANATLWVSIMLGIVVVMSLAWFFIPIYIVGVSCYAISVISACLVYVKQRNARVLDFDRILTVDHIKSLLSSGGEVDEGMDSFLFITANKNDVPRPEARTPDFFGYRIAYDVLTEAISRRAEFITLVPGPENYKIAFQIDGTSVPQAEQPKDQIDFFLRFAKQLVSFKNFAIGIVIFTDRFNASGSRAGCFILTIQKPSAYFGVVFSWINPSYYKFIIGVFC
ncbi:MAG: hypothetical protein ABIK07_22480 [Planctomycetota bacterium]